MLREWLSTPQLKGVALDENRRIEVHGAIIKEKPLLRGVYEDFHKRFLELDRRYFGKTQGMRIELGAGIAPVRDTDPGILATDVVPAPGIDRQLDAMQMDLPDRSVRAFFGQNCFHHFPHPAKFFAEAQRTLAPGGGIVLIEPYFGVLASFLFRRLHLTENFDPAMSGWDAPMTGPMGGANQALSYIVFWRDRAKFAREFPGLSIIHTEPLSNYMRYIFSGGFTYRQLLPDFAEYPLIALEKMMKPLRRWLAINHVIVIRRS